jgi:hypothetical protein
MGHKDLEKAFLFLAAIALSACDGNGGREDGGDDDPAIDDGIDQADDDGGGDTDGPVDPRPDDGTESDIPVETTDRIEQYGIAWVFEAPVPYGQFANGDYWVLEPVTITSITPDFDGEHHGWEVNPSDNSGQGFDVRVADYQASHVPALPYAAAAGQSIVKSVSIEPLDDADCGPCLQTAAVLTVLGAVPPDGGATVFRPPYFSAEKTLYSATDLRTDLLPSLAPTASAPAMADVEEGFRRVQLDHKENWTGRAMHPADNLPDYGSSISGRNAEGALRLMLDDGLDAKMNALIYYVQYGIDLYAMMLGGVSWPPNGGHSEGRKLPMAFAAVLLDDQDMKDAVTGAPGDRFGETGGMYLSAAAGVVLYGQGVDESMYWENLVFDTGSRTLSDPHGLIDGGHRPGDSYQFCCLSMPWKSNATALLLMPELAALWNYQPFFDYVERWVSQGAWAQPDTCAPPDGVCSGGDNAGAPCTSASEPSVCTGTDAFCDLTVSWDAHYGVTYGPDGSGGCIQDTDPSDGTGRFPALHGTNADSGYYGSAFADEMWDAYHP